MRRSLRKRKLSPDHIDEPAAPKPAPVSVEVPTVRVPPQQDKKEREPPVLASCNLCKKLCPDLRADPEIADKIIDCLGLGISPEVDPTGKICAGCIERVDRQHAFRRRALHCNSYVESGLEEAEDENVCRFCLKANKQQLVELFPGGAVAYEVGKIRDCLAIEINSWDAVIKICDECIKGIDELSVFRAEFSPTAVPVKLEEVADSSDSYSIRSENDDDDEVDLDYEFESDYSIVDEEEEPEMKEKRQSTTTSVRSLPWIKTDHMDRNFDVLDETDETVEVVFDEYPFEFRSILSDGSSLWACVQYRLRGCQVKLKIDSQGVLASGVGSSSKHTHLNELDKLMECPEGKGLTMFEGKEQPFWLLYGQRDRSQYTRSLIFAGFKYFLHQIRFKGLTGIWNCQNCFRQCSVVLRIDALFEEFEMRGRHSHPPLAQWEIDHALRLRGINDASLEAFRTFQRTTSRAAIQERAEKEENLTKLVRTGNFQGEKKVQPTVRAKPKRSENPEIYKVLQREDPDRNFEVVQVESSYKVIDENRYEYCYFSRLEDDSTLWKCTMTQLRYCKAIAQVSGDGKRMILIERKHNHETRPIELLNYPLGKRVIADEPVWLLKYFSPYHESRRVLYRGFMYILYDIAKHGIIRWKCLKKQTCPALMLSEGDFRKLQIKGEHTHEELSQSSIDSMLSSSWSPKSRNVVEQIAADQPDVANGDPMQILTTIGCHDSGRNFTVKQIGNKLMVNWGDHAFRFKSIESNGSSLWCCVWIDILRCPVKLLISANGKKASTHGTDQKHNHLHEDIPVFCIPDGKRLIYDENTKRNLSCFLFTYNADFFKNRGIIYLGRKYTLCRIDNKGYSTWKCHRTCTGYIKVECNLRSILCKNSHQHTALTLEEIKSITGSDQLDNADLLEASTFTLIETASTSLVPPKKGPLNGSDLLEILSVNDPDRNFKVQIHKKNMKIILNDFEYYYNISTAKYTSWKCVYTTIRACRAAINLDNACKTATLPEIPRHSHSTKPWPLLSFPQGKNTIIDAQTNTEKPFWYRVQPNFLRPIFSFLYEGHRYRLVFLNESGSSSTWGCSSSRRCNVRIFVDGLFKRVRNGNSIHAEPAMCATDQASWIEQAEANGGGGEDQDV